MPQITVSTARLWMALRISSSGAKGAGARLASSGCPGSCRGGKIRVETAGGAVLFRKAAQAETMPSLHLRV
jgi:hypothetical protein